MTRAVGKAFDREDGADGAVSELDVLSGRLNPIFVTALGYGILRAKPPSS